MKVWVLRLLALIVTATLITAGYLVMFPQSIETLKNETQEAAGDENYLVPTPPLPRGTRASTDWPNYRYDNAHLGSTTSSVPDDNTILWSNTTTASGEAYGSPIIADGKVFIGSRDGYLYCFDLNTGDRLWRTFLSSADFGVCGSPAVANDHVVVFCSGSDTVYRLRVSDGGINWSFPTSGAYGGSSPAINNGRVYIGSGNRNVYCLDEITGNMIWSYTTGVGPVRPYGIQSSPAVANGRVFIGSCDCYLYCINESQPSAPAADYYWRTNLFDAIFASPAVANGRVYCGSGYYVYSEGTGSHTMFCLDELTGAVIWSYLTGSDILSSPAIAYGYCYFTSTDGNLYCVDAMHPGPTPPPLIWSNTTGDTWSSPSVSDGKVVVGSMGSNTIYCYNATIGDLVWSRDVGNDVYSSPAIADGRVVVGVRGNPESVVCFGPPFEIDYVQIRDAPNGGGTNLCDPANYPTYPVGYSTTFYSAAYNHTAGHIGDVPITSSWSSDNAAVSVDFPPTGFSTGITCNSPGIANITLDCEGLGVITNTTQVSVVVPTVDYIQIRDAPNGGGLNLCNPINYPSYPVGHITTFYGAEYNSTFDFYIGDVPTTSTWGSTDTGIVDVSSPGNSSTITCSNTNWGPVTIDLDHDGFGLLTNTTQVTVIAPTADYVQIRDGPNGGGLDLCDPTNYPSYPVGRTTTFYSAAFNYTANYIGNVSLSSTWSSDNTSIVDLSSPGNSSTITCSNTNWGTVMITLDNEGLGAVTNFTLVTVLKPMLDYIVIRTGPNGTGSWVGDSTYIFGDNDTFYAGGYNDTAGWIEDVPADWSSNDSSIGNVSPGPSNSTAFSALNNGTCKINATYNTFTNSTGVITIINYTVDYIRILDSPGKIANLVGDRVFIIGETANFYAAAYNHSAPDDGYIGNVNVDWYCSNVSIATVTTPGVSTLFTAQFVGGECNVTAAYSPSIDNITGNLTVLNPELDYILITDAFDGTELTTVFLNVGRNTSLFASGYNITGDTYVGPVEVDWSESAGLGSIAPPKEIFTTYTAGITGGPTTITGQNVTLGVSDDCTLIIRDPTVDYIQIRDQPNNGGNIVTARAYDIGSNDTFYVAAYNRTSGFIDDAPAEDTTWGSGAPAVGDVSSPDNPTTFDALSPGTCVVWASYNDVMNSTGLLTVRDPMPDYIQIRDASGGLGDVVTDGTYNVGMSPRFWVALYNYSVPGHFYDNAPATETTWGSDNESVGTVSSPNNPTTFNALSDGTCTVTASFGGRTNTTGTLTVITPEVDYIQIRDAAGGGGTVVETLTIEEGNTTIFYAAGYNITSGYVRDVSDAEWDIDSDIGTVTTPGYSTMFNATKQGTGNITVSHPIHDEITNSSIVTVIDTTAPEKPDAPALDIVDGNVQITWPANNETDLAGYEIWRRETGGNWEQVGEVDADTTTFTDANVTKGKTYEYRIVAVDDNDNPSMPSDSDPAGIKIPEKEEFPWILLWIFLIIAIIVVLILFFVLLKRRKAEEEPPRQVLPSPPPGFVGKALPPLPPLHEKEIPPPPPEEEIPPPPPEEEVPPPPSVTERELPPPPHGMLPKKELPHPPEEEIPEDELPPPPDD